MNLLNILIIIISTIIYMLVGSFVIGWIDGFSELYVSDAWLYLNIMFWPISVLGNLLLAIPKIIQWSYQQGVKFRNHPWN